MGYKLTKFTQVFMGQVSVDEKPAPIFCGILLQHYSDSTVLWQRIYDSQIVNYYGSVI